MTAPQFTLGPWIVHPVVAQVDCQKLSAKGGLLPVCQMLWPTYERTETETEANANLIAAAPELYEALEMARYCAEQIAECPRYGGRSLAYMRATDILRRANLVLAKARGEAA